MNEEKLSWMLEHSFLRLSRASCLNLHTSQSRVVSSMPRTSSRQIDHFSNHRFSFSTKLPGHMFRHGTNQSCQLVIIFSHQLHAENPPAPHCNQYICIYIRYPRFPEEGWKKVQYLENCTHKLFQFALRTGIRSAYRLQHFFFTKS